MDVKIEEVIGHRIQVLRESLASPLGERVSQTEFGRRLGPLLGKEWSRQAVWMAESGKRAFTAVELVAIAHVLRTPVASLMLPPGDLEGIEMPTGATIAASEFAISNQLSDIPEHLQQRIFHLYGQVLKATKQMKQIRDAAVNGLGDLDGGIETVAALVSILDEGTRHHASGNDEIEEGE